jgi:AcrR family transcriptional regulator
LAKKIASDLPDTSRLDAKAWTAAALVLLAEQGIDGVRVEPLAARMHVTKGSFYWHFKDRDALFEAMLGDWRRRATLQVIERIEQTEEPPRTRLQTLLRVPFSGRRPYHGAEIELSIRLWGRREARARTALEEVDQLRLRYIAQLLKECGVPSKLCEARAIMAYSYMRVASTLMGDESKMLQEQCEAILINS